MVLVAKPQSLFGSGSDRMLYETHSAVTEAAETVRGIKHVYVEGVQAIVEDNQVVKYRVNAKLTFVVGAESG